MAGLGLPELVVILVLVLVLFGAGRLPQVFESLGRGIRALREAASVEDEANQKISDTRR
ncbi:MAG: twin-arginine translocase TatA/TatE family subunit, partial [Myxococcota bacterium]